MEKVASLLAGEAVAVGPVPGGVLFAHGLSCPECRYGHAALWGFAPLGVLPPNGICPSCGHKWELPPEVRDALAVAAQVPQLAVLLDSDNFDTTQMAELKAWFVARGNLAIFRAYGNLKTFAGSAWEEALEAGLDLITCDVRPQAADMAIAVDLGVLAAARAYHELFVVSADRALLIAAEHIAFRFGGRQKVYWGPPHPLMLHTEQCRVGAKHARKEEVVGLLQLMVFEAGGRVKSDHLHRSLLETVPYFHARIYNHISFPEFIAEHFIIERNGDGHWVLLPDEASDALAGAQAQARAAHAATFHHRRRRRAS